MNIIKEDRIYSLYIYGFYKYFLPILLALTFMLYFPIYLCIFFITFSIWVARYIWISKIKKQLFVVIYTFDLPETNKIYDLILYFLIFTPIYFATNIFVSLWHKQIKLSVKTILLLPLVWTFTFFTGIPLLIIKIVKYWHVLILTYISDPQEFNNNYFHVHEYFFLKN